LASLSYSDVISVAPPASNMPTYTDAITNSYCSSYMCAGAAVTKAAADFSAVTVTG
jgi:hypothetical protein